MFSVRLYYYKMVKIQYIEEQYCEIRDWTTWVRTMLCTFSIRFHAY